MNNLENITGVLDFGNNEEKIKMLESLASTKDIKIIQKIITKLDDNDIQVRGEAFSSLVSNENKISGVLINNLESPNKEIRAFTALILANRHDSDSIPEIIKLTNDQHSIVRSCALGALGHLKAKEAKEAMHNCVLDSSLEVRKSAIQAIINIEEELSENEIQKNLIEGDLELERLVANVKRKSGPKGI